MAAAAARLRLSARPRIGMRTRASAAAASSAGTPRASLPNSHSTGPASSAPRSGRDASPPPSAARTVTPAARSAATSGGSGADRTTSTWKRLPALARTALPPYGSVDPAPKTTAPAPHASAVRSTVPALPGSFSSASATASRGGAATTSAAGTSRSAQTATSPCGLTVSDRLAAAFSVTGRTGTDVLPSRSAEISMAAGVANTSRTDAGSASASRTACRPSARNAPAASRPARRVSLRAATTRAERSVSGSVTVASPRHATTPPGPAPRGRTPTASSGSCSGSGGGAATGRRGRDRSAGGLDQRGEGSRLVHRELGEHAAVELDAGQLQALHEPVVGHVVLAGRGVDPGDPQLAEVALADLAVAVGVGGRVEHLLLGLAVEPRALTAVSAGRLEGRPALLLGVDRPLHACHVSSLMIVTGGGSDAQQLLQVLGVGGRQHLVPVEPALAGRGLVLELVLVVGLLAHELARARHAHALDRALVGLLLRHVLVLFGGCRAVRQHGAAARHRPSRWCGAALSRAPAARVRAVGGEGALSQALGACSSATGRAAAGRSAERSAAFSAVRSAVACRRSACAACWACCACTCAFRCGAITMTMFRPSCLGLDSTTPSSATSAASRCSSRYPISGRDCSRPRNITVILTLSPLLRKRSTWPFLVS